MNRPCEGPQGRNANVCAAEECWALSCIKTHQPHAFRDINGRWVPACFWHPNEIRSHDRHDTKASALAEARRVLDLQEAS